jgi:hypothetical protein
MAACGKAPTAPATSRRDGRAQIHLSARHGGGGSGGATTGRRLIYPTQQGGAVSHGGVGAVVGVVVGVDAVVGAEGDIAYGGAATAASPWGRKEKKISFLRIPNFTESREIG